MIPGPLRPATAPADPITVVVRAEAISGVMTVPVAVVTERTCSLS
jgi:hypothetical protein